MDATPEELLGLQVIGPAGDRIGTVVDVGLFNWRQPKFLLVQPERATGLLRVELGDVEDVAPAGIRLSVPPRPASLPA